MNLQLFAEERREQPTQRRREEARRRGQVARSHEIGVLVTLVFGVLALRVFGSHVVGVARQMSVSIWSSMNQDLTERTVRGLLLSATWDGLKMVGPIMAVVAAAALFSELAQVGFLFASEGISFDLSRVDPFAGLSRMFSRRQALELVKAIVKVLIVGLSLWQVMRDAALKLPELVAMPVPLAASWGAGIVWRMVMRCALLLVVIAAADYVFQWRENEASLMMTRRELLEELKETEGRPEVRQRIRARQRQMAMGRMMDAVKKADVVVANPEHFAVALRYDGEKMAAPQVLAKGAGWLAQRIKEEARKYSVTIVENPAVARALYYSTEVGEAIPPSLYQAVAEILAFVYRLKAQKARA